MKSFFSCMTLFVVAATFFSCSKDKLHQHKEWKAFFEANGLEGCVMLHDYYGGTFDVYGLGEVQARTLPGGTFNIMNALVGLETGVVRDTSMLLPDTAASGPLAGLSMGRAFRTGNRAYFQWVARKVGHARMQYWIDSTYYGNQQIGTDLSAFWTNNTLTISPDEQMGLMEKLYQGRLAFQSRSQQLVKALLIQRTTHSDTLRYISGTGQEKSGTVSWLVGWLQHKDEPHFFVLKALAADSATQLADKSLNILYKVLQAKGLATETGRLN